MKIMGRYSNVDKFSSRIGWVGLGITLFGALIAGRIFYIQFFQEDYYRALAESQYNRSIPIIYQRGEIYFESKDGNLLPAATTRPQFIISINPRILENAEEAFQKLKDLISLDYDNFIKKTQKKDDPYEVAASTDDKDVAEKIQSFGIKGVNVSREDRRFYPGNNLASHVLGFVGYSGNDLNGRYGIERFYESYLASKDGKASDIATTIEPQVQQFLEDSLRKTKEKWKAESAGAIVLNPKTGEILAMAAEPDFDPNNYKTEKNFSVFVNPLVENIFEMGSVMKPITLSIALNEHKITPETTYFDKGFLVFNNKRIENFDGKGRGKIDMQRVLDESLNTGAVFVMQRAGKENFRNYLARFGFSEKTGIDLPGEVSGNTSNLNSGRDIEYATASFGQGIAVSPIEFTMAVSAISNGGNLIKPYIVKKITNPENSDIIKDTEILRRVIAPETSETVTRMLVKVVDEALAGGTVAMPRYSIAAKTGTAQIPKKDGRGYSDQYLHSFFGYAPAFDPKFLIFLYLEKPQGVRYASQSLTSLFMDNMKFLLNYYEVPPDR